MTYEIQWAPSALRDLERLPEKVAGAAVEFLYGPVSDIPQRVGRPLRFELEGLHAARRGDYRVVYRIDSEVELVVVHAIQHRADVYRPR